MTPKSKTNNKQTQQNKQTKHLFAHASFSKIKSITTATKPYCEVPLHKCTTVQSNHKHKINTHAGAIQIMYRIIWNKAIDASILVGKRNILIINIWSDISYTAYLSVKAFIISLDEKTWKPFCLPKLLFSHYTVHTVIEYQGRGLFCSVLCSQEREQWHQKSYGITSASQENSTLKIIYPLNIGHVSRSLNVLSILWLNELSLLSLLAAISDTDSWNKRKNTLGKNGLNKEAQNKWIRHNRKEKFKTNQRLQ